MKKISLATLSIAIVIAGCIASGTVVYVFDFDGAWASRGGLQTQQIDLSSNKDYQDNKDKLKSVDSIVLVGDIVNLGPDSLKSEIYISDNSSYSDTAQVRHNAIRIFVSPNVPAHDTLHINWSDGLAYIENLPALTDELKGDGQFTIYAISSSSTPITYNLHLIATLTIGM